MASLFKELKPLMNATFEASQSINRTAPILAWTQALMIVLLSAIFLALFGLLVTLNPDLETERRQFITPAVRYVLNKVIAYGCIAMSALRKPTAIVRKGLALVSGSSHVAKENANVSGNERNGSRSSGKKNS